MVRSNFFSIITFFFVLYTSGFSQTIYQWRYDRSGNYPDTGLLAKWPDNGPALLWSNETLPKGFSSPAVTPDMIFVTGISDTLDILVALNKEGKIKWSTPYGLNWQASFSDSRCTPTVEGNMVYVSSGNGDVASISATDGKIIWKVQASKMFNGTYGRWGIAESLLIDGDRIFFTPGGSATTMIALNKVSGDLIWKSESINDNPAYVSPVMIEKDGRKIIINVTANYIIALDPMTGKIIWKVNHADINTSIKNKNDNGGKSIKCVTPLYNDGNIYITGGYDHGGIMLRLAEDGNSAKVVWTDSVLDVHHGGVVLVNGYIYGSNWINNSDGNWCCIDWNTGKKMYEEHWNCKGSVIFANGRLYIYDEKKGNVGLVNPNPEKFDLVSSFKITKGTGPHWAHPVIADGILYIRHGNTLLAYDIKEK